MHASLRHAGVLAVLSLGAVLAARPADANGRYPSAQFLVVGPGSDNQTLALQTTFGLVLSTDAGRNWHWVCEQGEGFAGMGDLSLGLTRDGALMITLPDGLSRGTSPFCDFPRPATAPNQLVVDIATDPNGTRAAAAVTPVTGANSIWVSNDLGQSWAAGWTHTGVFIETVDIAPGHPDRMYLSGYDTGTIPTLFRSDDGGQTFAPTSTNTHGGYDLFIAGVDPSNPDIVYLRSDLSSQGTVLLRSDDAGVTLNVVAMTMARMTGVAISPDGAHVWIAGRGGVDGVLRSDDHGLTFHQVSNPFTTLCLRYQNAILYACTDYATDGYALESSTDMGATFTPLLSFSELQGPDNCAAGTTVADRCNPLWPAQHNALMMDSGTRPPLCLQDGGCLDASTDTGTTTAPDANDGSIDGTIADAGTTHPRGACGCTIPGRDSQRHAPFALAALSALAAVIIRRRR